MIKNSSGEKCTPKQLAKLAVVSAIKNAVPHDCGEMTEKEVKFVEEQLEKVQARLLKILGTQEQE